MADIGPTAVLVALQCIGSSAPIPDVRRPAIELVKSTLTRRSRPRQKIVGSAEKQTFAPDSRDRLGLDAPMVRAALCNLQIYEARRQSSRAASARLGD
ncbi:MAG: hypothetical protein WB611_25310 [Stellaceae bacterium]